MFRNVVSGLARQRTALNGAQRRHFAGGHSGPKKEWTGIGKLAKGRMESPPA